jgi:hypothetical protein
VKKTGFALALVAALMVPAASPAEPSKADTRAASNFCHDLTEAAVSAENLKALGYDNFGDCVREVAKANAAARRAARKAALETCEDLRGEARRDCVRSEKAEAKAKRRARQQALIDAAATCTSLQEDAATFEATYGTGKDGYRKCVKENR